LGPWAAKVNPCLWNEPKDHAQSKLAQTVNVRRLLDCVAESAASSHSLSLSQEKMATILGAGGDSDGEADLAREQEEAQAMGVTLTAEEPILGAHPTNLSWELTMSPGSLNWVSVNYN
jgi:hypothetical protein